MKNQFFAMDVLRWILLPLVLFGAFFFGVFASFPIWVNYSAAFLIPTLGLYGVYLVAQKYKYKTTLNVRFERTCK